MAHNPTPLLARLDSEPAAAEQVVEIRSEAGRAVISDDPVISVAADLTRRYAAVILGGKAGLRPSVIEEGQKEL